MRARRRALLASAGLGLLATPALAAPGGRAQRIIVGFPPGQATDTVARLWAERLAPAYLSRPAVELPPERYSEMADLDVAMRKDARRFELGSVDFASCYAVNASLGLLAEVGTPAIEAHVLALAGRLRSGMAELGLGVPRRAQGAEASHIVTVGTLGNGGHGSANDPLLASISAHLAANDVVHTIRRGMLRFAFHLFNSDDDVDRVLGLAGEVVARKAA